MSEYESGQRLCVVCAKTYAMNVLTCPDDGSPLVVAADESTAAGGLTLGSVLGSYRLIKRIGEGGVGVVFEAEHVRLGRKIAIKVLHPDSLSHEIITRFFNEARAVNEIRHPNIIDIEDFVIAPSGQVYLQMELLEGRDLREALSERGTIDPRRVAHIGAQIASALGAVHDVGIIHRDLKPDNVFLITREADPDFVKILDFGVAKFTDDDEGITQSGLSVGTPEYMAPEQIVKGGIVDTRTDIYSLGMVLYECLTGTPAFHDTTMVNVLRAQMHEPVMPPSQLLNTKFPASLEAAIMKCLEKDGSNRFQHMNELSEVLRSTARGDTAPIKAVKHVVTPIPLSEPVQRKRKRRRSPRWWVLIPALLLAGVALLVTFRPDLLWFLQEPEPSIEPPKVVALANTVEIMLVSKPDRAEVFVGEERRPIGRTPQLIKVPMSTEPLQFFAKFADGSEVTEVIVPDRNPPPLVFVKPPDPVDAGPVVADAAPEETSAVNDGGGAGASTADSGPKMNPPRKQRPKKKWRPKRKR